MGIRTAVDGAGFMAQGITFENTAGPDGHQAVALRVDSDHSVFQSCSIVGFQDSLYTHALRQLYYNCSIEGTVDFIFGNAAAFFQNCNIIVRVGRPTAITSTLTAQVQNKTKCTCIPKMINTPSLHLEKFRHAFGRQLTSMNITLVKSCLIKPKQEPQEVFLKVVI